MRRIPTLLRRPRSREGGGAWGLVLPSLIGPTDIADLEHYHQARSHTLDTAPDPDRVVSLDALIGADLDTTPAADASKPTITTLGGQVAMRADEANAQYVTNGSLFTAIPQPWTVFVVFSLAAVPAGNAVMIGNGGGQNWFIRTNSGILGMHAGGTSPATTETLVADTLYTIGFTANGTSSKLYLDGVEVYGDADNLGTSTIRSCRINGWVGGTPHDQRYGESGIYSRALTPTEHADLAAYAAAEYA